jgi:hypothetical protein
MKKPWVISTGYQNFIKLSDVDMDLKSITGKNIRSPLSKKNHPFL